MSGLPTGNLYPTIDMRPRLAASKQFAFELNQLGVLPESGVPYLIKKSNNASAIWSATAQMWVGR